MKQIKIIETYHQILYSPSHFSLFDKNSLFCRESIIIQSSYVN